MFKFIFNLTLITQVISLNQQECCFESSLHSEIENYNIVIKHFTNFNQLNFKNCNKSQIVSTLQIIPQQFLLINKDLDFKSTSGRELKLIAKDIVIYFNFKLIKGFDLAHKNPFNNIIYTNKNAKPELATIWSFQDSYFDFYYDGNLIRYDSEYCNEDFFHNISYFIKMSCINLIVGVKFSNDMCPLVFKNSYITSLEIKRINFASINNNVFGFREDNLKIDYELNSNISIFLFTGYNLIIDNRILNEKVFEQVLYIEIGGVISSIQDDLFRSFWLKIIRFKIQHLSLFFHRGLKWLEYINLGIEIDYNNEMFINRDLMSVLMFHQVFNFGFYDYPNEDICLFEYFPHKRFVLPKLYPDSKSECTCTRLFLIQKAYKFKYEIDALTQNYDPSYFYFVSNNYYLEASYANCINDSIEQVLLKCNFESRFNKCHLYI